MRHFQCGVVLEQRLEFRERDVERHLALDEFRAAEEVAVARLAMLQGDVAGAARTERERDADELAAHRIERGRFRIQRDDARGESLRDPLIEALGGQDRLIGRAVDLVRERLRLARGGERPGREGGRRLDAFGLQRLRGRGARRVAHVAIPRAPTRVADEIGIGFDLARLDAVNLRHAACDGCELHRLQKSDELPRVGRVQPESVERRLQRNVAHEFDEALRQANERHGVRIGQRLAAPGLLDAGRLFEQRVEIAIFVDELGGGLDPDPFRARHIICRIPRERLHVDDLRRRHAEIIHDLGFRDEPFLARAPGARRSRRRVVHCDAGTDELHQILVGGHDQHIRAFFARLRDVGGDQIVGFVDVLLDGREAEGADRRAHERKLRNEVFRRLGAMRLVIGIDVLAKGFLALVEDDREMGRRHAGRALAHELQQLRAKEPHRARRQAVRTIIISCVLPDRLEIGAKDEGRAVDEKDMAAGADGCVRGGHGRIVAPSSARVFRAGARRLANFPRGPAPAALSDLRGAR